MMQQEAARKFIRVSEVAAALGVTRQRVYELIHEGRIPAVRISRKSLRVPGSWLDEWEARARANLTAQR